MSPNLGLPMILQYWLFPRWKAIRQRIEIREIERRRLFTKHQECPPHLYPSFSSTFLLTINQIRFSLDFCFFIFLSSSLPLSVMICIPLSSLFFFSPSGSLLSCQIFYFPKTCASSVSPFLRGTDVRKGK